ncbi:MAG: 6-bladed beta-propeller [Acidobacteria bacterium]|nr:6-bladed beta-propeller [Acidobacteriota bacterium]MBI3662662.1 6-bladed beta-propeller [Acidobacteriota bacterium]
MSRITSFIISCGLLFALVGLWQAAAGEARLGRRNANLDAPILADGRRIDFLRTFDSEKDVHPKRSIWNRLVDVVAGPPVFRSLIRPYSVTTDSRGRILVTDPGALGLHIFDFERKKYSFLDGGPRGRFESPIGVAVDAEDNIYVTDSRLGKVFVFDARGKFRHFLGERKGEGYFKRPTGIAIDPYQKRIYLCDTLYNKVFVLDEQGNILYGFGGRGAAPGQFNYPTALTLHGDTLIVLDTLNFRIQLFDRSGGFRTSFGTLGDRSGTFNRPKGVATDSEGNIYVTEGLFETVQIFNAAGQLLYYFGGSGNDTGEFQLPAGLWIDARERIYIADSYNRRVQVFQFTRGNQPSAGSPR